MKNHNYATDEAFEAFLKSVGGLENGYYTGRDPITARGYFAVDNGWLGNSTATYSRPY